MINKSNLKFDFFFHNDLSIFQQVTVTAGDFSIAHREKLGGRKRFYTYSDDS